ncbi:MAG TPA: glycerate kinase [Candidatus Enterocloster excrementipullorum]|uniref:Glycerate kinase n=1 Tax=Candidatus Enterocloster excrementipullorum TaxID=2838559 RepID=A0A9D2SGQ5_9FIRM|nr:glycerate kinase [Candidatus Enterocloster excrementipullorum]
MKVTIAIDSLKGSLSSLEAGKAIGTGVKKAWPEAEVCVRPLADGGEGTVEAVTSAMGGEMVTLRVTGPLGEPVDCVYGVIRESRTAVLEMAGAAGLTLLKDEERNPLKTTTYGVGEVIRDAVKRGCRHFLVGIGGSATNDGGIGMLQALGFGMLDKEGKQVPFGAQGLAVLERIEDGEVMPELRECTFRIACDVTNPLCGPQGCSAIYGPQKGADAEMIAEMDTWMEAYGALTEAKYPGMDSKTPGCGAAGGIGFAFYAFLGGVLESGIKIVLEETRLDDYVKDADIVVTGEGRLDGQTVMGKAPIGVAKTAKKYGKKVIAFSGSVTKDAIACNQEGIDAFFPILRRIVTLEEAMDADTARENMEDTSEQVFRLIRAFME